MNSKFAYFLFNILLANTEFLFLIKQLCIIFLVNYHLLFYRIWTDRFIKSIMNEEKIDNIVIIHFNRHLKCTKLIDLMFHSSISSVYENC